MQGLLSQKKRNESTASKYSWYNGERSTKESGDQEKVLQSWRL